MFLITGYGRSGTLYTANLLIKLGYKVGHEFVDRDGIVSWMHLDRANDFETVIHQVRHPLKVLSSAMSVQEKAWYRTFESIGQPKHLDRLYLIMYTWHHWCKLADEKSSFRFQIERLDEIYPVLFNKLNLTIPENLPSLPKDMHT